MLRGGVQTISACLSTTLQHTYVIAQQHRQTRQPARLLLGRVDGEQGEPNFSTRSSTPAKPKIYRYITAREGRQLVEQIVH
eukprot:scaffold3670_cov124-Cylindrotheca_fusiformis.AAC.10